MRNKRLRREQKKQNKRRPASESNAAQNNDENQDLADVESGGANIELLDKIKQEMALLDQEEKLGS